MSRRLVLSSFSDFCLFILSRVVCSLEHDLRSTMSSQKPGKTKQKSLLSWVKPQDTKARVEDENVEESCAAEIPEGSSESGQDYAAVESVKAVGSQLPLLGDRPNQPRNLSFPSKSYGNRNRSFQSGWFDRHPWLHYVESLDAVLTWWRSPICLWGTTSGASNCLGSFQKTTCR